LALQIIPFLMGTKDGDGGPPGPASET
jgi:hypothetical protein